jgi:hypothetical protein
MKPKAAQELSPELKSALEPMMREIESVSERICEYDQLLESMVRNRYPEADQLKQIKGVGTLIALTYMLTLVEAKVTSMDGDPATSVILDAYSKGIRGFDVEKAYAACKQTAAGSNGSTNRPDNDFLYAAWICSRASFLDTGQRVLRLVRGKDGRIVG